MVLVNIWLDFEVFIIYYVVLCVEKLVVICVDSGSWWVYEFNVELVVLEYVWLVGVVL